MAARILPGSGWLRAARRYGDRGGFQLGRRPGAGGRPRRRPVPGPSPGTCVVDGAAGLALSSPPRAPRDGAEFLLPTSQPPNHPQRGGWAQLHPGAKKRTGRASGPFMGRPAQRPARTVGVSGRRGRHRSLDHRAAPRVPKLPPRHQARVPGDERLECEVRTPAPGRGRFRSEIGRRRVCARFLRRLYVRDSPLLVRRPLQDPR